MGAECPNGHGRQNVIASVTADGAAPKRATDVIANRLACGCTVGGPQYEKFQEQVTQIRNEEKHAIAAVKEKFRQKMGTAFKAFTAKEE